MLYARVLAVAAVVVPLMAGTGCVTEQSYNRDIQAERVKTSQAVKERDVARLDLKKANDIISDLTAQVAALAKAQDQLADERKRNETLQASLKAEVDKAKRMQEAADREKMSKLSATSKNEASQLATAKARITRLEKEIADLKKEAKAPPAKPTAPPTPPAVEPPVNPAPAQ